MSAASCASAPAVVCSRVMYSRGCFSVVPWTCRSKTIVNARSISERMRASTDRQDGAAGARRSRHPQAAPKVLRANQHCGGKDARADRAVRLRLYRGWMKVQLQFKLSGSKLLAYRPEAKDPDGKRGASLECRRTEMRIFLFAITALIFSQQPASAFFYDGNELFRICRSDENFNSGLCLGIIIGAFDAYEISEIGPGVG